MKVLYIIRGLSGSGKTTIAEALSPHVFSADDYFTDSEGNYHFDPSELGDAHTDCQESVETAMGKAGNGLGWHTIAVANTFSQAWEAKPYFELAEKYSYSPFVIECQNNFQNIHNVPLETIDAMKMRWESSIT